MISFILSSLLLNIKLISSQFNSINFISFLFSLYKLKDLIFLCLMLFLYKTYDMDLLFKTTLKLLLMSFLMFLMPIFLFLISKLII